jgi:serine/threonine-protein kinase
VVVGTPAYMSPEQCRGQPLDGRSDIYTCGILLYQLVTGRVPFHSDSPFEIAGKQAFEPPPPPRSHRPDLHPELEALILETLAKSPAERPQSAAQLRDRLLALLPRLRGAPVAATGLAGMTKTVPLHAVAGSIDEALRAAKAASQASSEASARALATPAQTGPFAPVGGGPPPSLLAARGPLGTNVEPGPWPPAPSAFGDAQPAPLPPAGAPPTMTGSASSLGAAPSEPSGPSGAVAALLVLVALLGGVGLGLGIYKLVG